MMRLKIIRNAFGGQAASKPTPRAASRVAVRYRAAAMDSRQAMIECRQRPEVPDLTGKRANEKTINQGGYQNETHS